MRISRNLPFELTVNKRAIPQIKKEHVLTMTPGVHRIRVVLPPPADRPYLADIVLFKGNINIEPGTETFAYIDNKGGYYVHTRAPLSNAPTAPQLPPPSPSENPYYDEHANYPPPVTPSQPSTPTFPQPPTHAPKAMDAVRFAELKATIKDQSFDDTRLSIARQAVEQNKMDAEQVKQIMSVFSFESSRLSWAKYAYRYVIDRENYATLYSGLQFNSSVDELIKYVREFK